MDEKEIRSVDKENMLQVLKDFPMQVNKGWQLAEKVKITGKPEKIMVTGMGGSCLPGEILASYAERLSCPILLNRDYELPNYADPQTLVFVISYSGNTEETVSALKEAKRMHAQCVVIASGGKLKELAAEYKIAFVEVPSGLQPRFAYGYLFLVILRILQNSGLIEDQQAAVEKTVETLRKDIFRQRAEELADQLVGKIPVIYTSDRMRAIAYKWKINFNENTKINAFYNVFPELNHNEMNGYVHVNGNYHVIIIKDENDHTRTQKRMNIFKELVKQRGVEVTEIGLSGPNRLAKLISAIYIGDWVSFYLAIKMKQDPTPVKMIEDFKKRMAS